MTAIRLPLTETSRFGIQPSDGLIEIFIEDYNGETKVWEEAEHYLAFNDMNELKEFILQLQRAEKLLPLL